MSWVKFLSDGNGMTVLMLKVGPVLNSRLSVLKEGVPSLDTRERWKTVREIMGILQSALDMAPIEPLILLSKNQVHLNAQKLLVQS